MEFSITSYGQAAKIWLLTAFFFSIGLTIAFNLNESVSWAGFGLLAFVVTLIGSFPTFPFVWMAIFYIGKKEYSTRRKFLLLVVSLFALTIPYGLIGASMKLFGWHLLSDEKASFLAGALLMSSLLFAAVLIALLIQLRSIYDYFSKEYTGYNYFYVLQIIFFNTSKININMETQHEPALQSIPQNGESNRILTKGLITGGLILIMLIPTLFITNLVSERETRQKEVVQEVSSKWAAAQNLSGPFLVVPYIDTVVNSQGKSVANKTKLLLLANDLNVNGNIVPEERPRSIYKVLLYRTDVSISGSFKVNLPSDVNPAAIDYANARLCFSLSDFKGIEEEIYVNFNGQKLLMSPGMPTDDFGSVGLSVPVSINAENIAATLPFNMQVKLKGSEQLHFTPLSATSKFQLSSSWKNPSFDGEVLPSERTTADNGFVAKWNFNQANLPFAMVLRNNAPHEKAMAFGVKLVQPADQYNKTMRSVKYAILFIGLTFAFFFIIELMQKKPFHPVQYVLVGLALVIFYTLLLSISEYILFDFAYLIAALATILLISVYAKTHFNSWKTASIFFALLSCLYGFIFVLIRLEDTALLVGSIGLFIVLAVVMFASRKINWYGKRG